VSKEATELYLSYGIEYDHSMSHHDCQAYYLRTGDDWTKIDYSKKAKEWMKPLVKGKPTGMVEIPANWYLDDLPPLMFMKSVPNSHGFMNARDIEDIWRVGPQSLELAGTNLPTGPLRLFLQGIRRIHLPHDHSS
jgi:hypothetical protein